jgi:hypothetical protein
VGLTGGKRREQHSREAAECGEEEDEENNEEEEKEDVDGVEVEVAVEDELGGPKCGWRTDGGGRRTVVMIAAGDVAGVWGGRECRGVEAAGHGSGRKGLA